jgi:hypothetical protein
LLEDNFCASFAGKNEIHFCSNQGTLDEILNFFTRAVKKIFASSLNPDALLYRKANRLLDYDERMALLVPGIKDDIFRRYHFPHAAEIAFGRNLYR